MDIVNYIIQVSQKITHCPVCERIIMRNDNDNLNISYSSCYTLWNKEQSFLHFWTINKIKTKIDKHQILYQIKKEDNLYRIFADQIHIHKKKDKEKNVIDINFDLIDCDIDSLLDKAQTILELD